MAQPPAPKDLESLYAYLEQRTYITYRSRLKAYERIQSRGRAWNTALIALSAATTVASVGLLADDTMYGKSGETLFAACAILALAASLIVSALDYPGRTVRMEANYKEVQALSLLVEAERSIDNTQNLERYRELNATYADLIRNSENHTTADWKSATTSETARKSKPEAISATLTLLPYLTLVLPAWLFYEFGEWVILGAT